MAVTNFSPLLGLALPTTGDLSGTWGTTVNDSITSLTDSAVAGTTTLSTDADVTLSTTNGAANQARQAVLLCTGSRSVLRTITAPAQSKAYIVINATTGGYGVKVVGSGPTAGVTIANGRKALIAWNGSDFVVVASTQVDLASEVTGTLPVANGGTGGTTQSTARTGLGATTLGGNLFTITDPSAVTFPRFNADNTVSALSAADFRTAIGASSGTGDVVGPASATDNAIVRFDGTTGKLVQNSAVTVADTTGDITGGKYNKVTITAPATGSTLTIADGKTLTANNSLTLAGTDGTTMTFPSASASVGYLNIPAVADKTSAYTLGTGDVGKVVGVGTGGSIEIPNSTFAAGDAVLVFNNTSSGITITCTITTAYIAGTDADKATVTLATRGLANILFISGTACVITGNVS